MGFGSVCHNFGPRLVSICFTMFAVMPTIPHANSFPRGVYTQNLWSFLDVTFIFIYFIYLVLRIHGYRVGMSGLGEQAFDVLALAAPVLVPRLAFTLLSENLIFLCLRSMMADFFFLTALSAWCFFGFLLSLLWLGEGAHPIVYVFLPTAMLHILLTLDLQHDIKVDDLHLVWTRWHRNTTIGQYSNMITSCPA